MSSITVKYAAKIRVMPSKHIRILDIKSLYRWRSIPASTLSHMDVRHCGSVFSLALSAVRRRRCGVTQEQSESHGAKELLVPLRKESSANMRITVQNNNHFFFSSAFVSSILCVHL